MIDKKSESILIRPRTWVDDLQDRFPHLFRDIDRFNFAVGEGWKEIVTSLCEKLDALRLPDLKVVQVKEKFGGLRFYVHDGNEEAEALIREAMEASKLGSPSGSARTPCATPTPSTACATAKT